MPTSVPEKWASHKEYLLSVMQEKNKASPSPLKRLPPTAVSGLHPTRQRSIKEGPHHLILKVHRNSGHLSHSVPLTWEKWMLRRVSMYSQRKRTWCLLRLNLKQVNIRLQERKGGGDEGKGHFLETSILSPQEPIWSEAENLRVSETRFLGAAIPNCSKRAPCSLSRTQTN